MTWSFTGFCKPKFCSDMCNAGYQEKHNKQTKDNK